MRPPPRPTLFPYTTLFRSSTSAARPGSASTSPACSRRCAWPNRIESAALVRFLIVWRSEEHTSELQSQSNLVCRLLLEKKNRLRTDTDSLAAVARIHAVDA